jgi:hypothetical protein
MVDTNSYKMALMFDPNIKGQGSQGSDQKIKNRPEPFIIIENANPCKMMLIFDPVPKGQRSQDSPNELKKVGKNH